MPKPGTFHNLWQRFPLRSSHLILNILLLAVPAAFLLHYALHPSPVLMFLVAALAIVPLAGVLGEATEDLAVHVGETLGGLLNATMGNATELIIAIFALRAGHVEVVKASLSGSIIGNILLVFGAAALAGGWGREKQNFSRRHASINTTMLFIAVVGLVTPAVFALSVLGHLDGHSHVIALLSLWTSVILLGVYLASLVFSLGTHRTAHAESGEPEEKPRPATASVVSLVLATVLIAVLSEVLVSQIEAARQMLGTTELFLGVVVIAVVGNAAEHATAVLFAIRNRMELALGIAVGSSAQIALLVAPVLVFASWFMGRPMSLVFVPLELIGIAFAVITVEMIASDGETTWFEGVQLLAVYAILAVAFYFVPEGAIALH